MVAFVYVTPVGQAGWTYQHDLGRREMEHALGDAVKTTVVEGVAEGPDAERVMRDLASQGHQLIFATSFGYLEGALRVAADFPAVRFEHAGGYKTAPNLNNYNVRAYEARWLAGRLAALNSKSGIAGYVAGFPVPEVVQGINAFALGMRSVNPRASVRVVWLNSWFDPARERDAALALVNQGADVLANHTASPAVALAAEEKGVKLIANQSDMRAFAPHAQLAAVMPSWGGYYTQVARDVIAGRWKPEPVWGGLRAGIWRWRWIRCRGAGAGRRCRAPQLTADPRPSSQHRRSTSTLHPFSAALDDDAIAKMDYRNGVVAPAFARPRQPLRHTRHRRHRIERGGDECLRANI
jgi:simple sugar transport system substrate-binding protein